MHLPERPSRAPGPPATEPPRHQTAPHVDLVSQWRMPAPPGLVWAALADPTHWPRWWPAVCEVRTLRQGNASGLGGVHHIGWGRHLPGRAVLEVEAMDAPQWQRMRAALPGPFDAQGLWLLRADGGHTDVTGVWRLHLDRPWQRGLLLVLAPLLRHAHKRVMRHGEAGLRQHLAQALVQPRPAASPSGRAASGPGPPA